MISAKSNKRVLITGASGMLGSSLLKVWTDKFDLYATSTQENLSFAGNYKKFDLISGNYKSLIEWSKPDYIIHSAALTNGNICDANPELAMKTNGLVLNELAKVISDRCRLVYISTDAVFPSASCNSKEGDQVLPESVYGKSKELGEFFVQLRLNNYSIIRTTIVGFNQLEGRQGFTEWIVNSAKAGNSIGLFEDVKFTPISCVHLAEMMEVIIETKKFKNEIVHIGSSEIYSKYDFGLNLLKALGFSAENVEPNKIAQFKDRAKRSTDQSLNSDYFMEETGIDLPDMNKTIQQLKKEFNE
jgi:dTDP-4-dehydrorhamnose reductase